MRADAETPDDPADLLRDEGGGGGRRGAGRNRIDTFSRGDIDVEKSSGEMLSRLMYIDTYNVFPSVFYVTAFQFFNARCQERAKTDHLIEWETTVVLITVT